MAGVAYPGVTDLDLGWDLAAPFVGSNPKGVGRAVFNQWTEGTSRGPNIALKPPEFLGPPDWAGVVTAAGGGGARVTPVAYPGADDSDAAGLGEFYYEKIHILPKTKIEFGNIITQVEEEYEIYSAFRHQSVTESSITNNALPGTELPNNTPPIVVPRQTSILDPTTTGQTSGALGTIVKLKVRATADGLPSFDTNIVFNFSPGNDPQLLVSGSRIVLLPQEFESPTKEVLAFLTDIIEALDGKEQRLALRSNPRQMFDITYLLDTNDRQRMQAMLMDWMDNSFGFPLWHEKLKLTAAHTAATSTYSVSRADDVDMRVGGLAAVITDANTFDVINVSAATDTLITAGDPSVNAYPIGTPLMPVRVVVIRRAVTGKRYLNNLEEFRISFEVTDNDTGVLTGTTTPGFWSIYNGRVLFDDCNVVSGGTMSQRFTRLVHRIDNATGIISQSSSWDKYKRSHKKGFVAHNRAENIELRRVLIALRGRQKSFYIPTFIEDVDVVAQLGVGTSTMDIESIDYVRFIKDRDPKMIMRLTFNNGDPQLIRVVQSSVTVSGTVERLTLDTTWPSTVPINEITRVEFFELVRFDTDNFNIFYPRIGLSELNASVKSVFDDD